MSVAVPDHVPPELVVEWDHYLQPEVLESGPGAYADMHARGRMVYSPRHGGFWIATNYADLHAALQSPELWSSRYVSIPAREISLVPLTVDPPEHTKYRQLINSAFAPGRIALLEDKMRELCRGLIEPLPARGEFDFLEVFARPFPSTIFTELFGIPSAEWPTFVRWADGIVYGDVVSRAQATTEVEDYLREQLAERARARSDDILSFLLDLEIDGDRLSPDEVLAFGVLLFVGGLHTVTASLGHAFRYLAEHPSHRQLILDAPSTIPDTVEELLRFDSMVVISRTATGDFEFGGVHVKEGDRLLVALANAGRDPVAFDHATTVDFSRAPNRHLAFGAGPHRCVGSHLARQELRIAIEEWHRVIPNYAVQPGFRAVYHGAGIMGLSELPLVVERS